MKKLEKSPLDLNKDEVSVLCVTSLQREFEKDYKAMPLANAIEKIADVLGFPMDKRELVVLVNCYVRIWGGRA